MQHVVALDGSLNFQTGQQQENNGTKRVTGGIYELYNSPKTSLITGADCEEDYEEENK